MASNPMQRKSRNSFLLGMIITLVITGVIIALLLVLLKQKNDEIQAEQEAKINVYALTQNVSAGQTLTEDMFAIKRIHKDSIPSNATALQGKVSSWFLKTKEGETVGYDEYGLYLPETIGETRIEVLKNTGASFKDYSRAEIKNGDFYFEVIEPQGIGSRIVKVVSKDLVKEENGRYFINTEHTRLYVEQDLTDEFYIYSTDTEVLNNTGITENKKQYIPIKNVPVLAKVDMNANTVITPELIVQSSEIVTDDTREEEYNMILLPIDLMTDDYIDIRYMTPSGQNFIVVSKARVVVPQNEDGTYIADTIRVNLREDEILTMSSAIIEAYGVKGSKLYATKYVEPAMQPAALPTYTPNASVTAQLQTNPNLVDIATNELRERYSEAAKNVRNEYIQKEIDILKEENKFNSNVESGIESDIGTSVTVRKKYLDSLNY